MLNRIYEIVVTDDDGAVLSNTAYEDRGPREHCVKCKRVITKVQMRKQDGECVKCHLSTPTYVALKDNVRYNRK